MFGQSSGANTKDLNTIDTIYDQIKETELHFLTVLFRHQKRQKSTFSQYR